MTSITAVVHPYADQGPIRHIRTTQIRNGRINWSADRFVTKAIYDRYMTRGISRVGDILFTMEAPLVMSASWIAKKPLRSRSEFFS